MFGGNVKLDKALLERATRYAKVAGYAHVDEFVAHALENELKRLDDAKGEGQETDPAVLERLRGLGYIE